MIKISVLGDIMCEPRMIKAAHIKNKSYDFSKVFEHVHSLLTESDLVIGNLETPIAGKEARYSNSLFSFNAPDEFVDAIINAGISFLSTANNHCLDRGLDGLIRTIQLLDSKGIAHDGTFIDPNHIKTPYIVEIQNIKISIIVFTYGTNYGTHHRLLPDDRYVNLLHSEVMPIYLKNKKKGLLSAAKRKIFGLVKQEYVIAAKKAMKMQYNYPREDNYIDFNAIEPYFRDLVNMIKEAKKHADFVLFYPHVGGQFNLNPGQFTERVIDTALENKVDAIVASHPHVVQKAVSHNGTPVFYSIGNFSMSPNSVYLLHENLPDYGLIVHFYLSNGKNTKTSFSIIKMVEKKNDILTVFPLDKIWSISDTYEKNEIEKSVKQIYRTVTGKDLIENVIQKEYLMD